MCLLAIAWRTSAKFPLVLATNRDEFHDRPSAPADWWAEPASILGGLDLRAGGSWLAVDQAGRLAVVTNVRRPGGGSTALRSRGHLVREFLTKRMDTAAYLDHLRPTAASYGPLNLLVSDNRRLAFFSNQGGEGESRDLPPGVYGLSNASLDTPWPKVERIKGVLRDALEKDDPAPSLFAALADDAPAADSALPDTGVGIELERRLSAPFIRGADYGTRCSTVVIQTADGAMRFEERRFDAQGHPVGGSEFGFQLV